MDPRSRRAQAALAVGLLLAVCALAPGRASAAATFRAQATADNGSSGASSLTIAVPTGTVAKDVMVAAISSAGAAPPAPSGWTQVTAASTTFTGGSVTVYDRVAGAGEPSSYTWSLPASAQAVGAVLAYAGVDNNTPVDVAGSNSGNSKSHQAPGVTTGAANETVVALDAYTAGSSQTINTPSGTTRRAVAENGGSAFMGVASADYTQSSVGNTGQQNFMSGSKIAYGAAQVALVSAGSLSWGTAPALPTLPGLTLNGGRQADATTMTSFAVSDTTSSGAGWRVTANGDASAGNSAVLKQYCPNATCGSDSGPGYVSGGYTLPAGSLTLNSTGASFTGGTGGTPTLACNAGCALDSASPTTIASAAANAGAGTWQAGGFGASSLSVAVPTTIHKLPANEVYRVNVVWTLSTGP